MAPVMAQAKTHDVSTPGGRIKVYSWSATGRDVALGRVLLVHGWTGRAAVMGAFVEPLRSAGFDVVALDLPAHGESTGSILNLAIGARAVQAVADAHGPFTCAVAHSFGGPIVLLAAEGGEPLAKPMPVERLVLIACPNALDEITQAFGDAVGLSPAAIEAMEGEILRIAGRPVAEFRCDAFLPRTGALALVIHDGEDVEVPVANATAIVAGAPTARHFRTEGLGHRRIIFAPRVVAAAAAFLRTGDVILPEVAPAPIKIAI
jgi:pimeloyl-ACP methyl ester carboxylesterase